MNTHERRDYIALSLLILKSIDGPVDFIKHILFEKELVSTNEKHISEYLVRKKLVDSILYKAFLDRKLENIQSFIPTDDQIMEHGSAAIAYCDYLLKNDPDALYREFAETTSVLFKNFGINSDELWKFMEDRLTNRNLKFVHKTAS